jgi:hypothetical protein
VPQGFSTFKGSLQPKGFYYQCLSNSPYNKPYIYSESSGEYWQIAENEIDCCFSNKDDGGSTENRLQNVCMDIKEHLISALNLGIEGLDNDHVTWKSESAFSSPKLDWLGNVTTNFINAEVKWLSNGLPRKIHYTSSDNIDKSYDITCYYDAASLPPSTCVIEIATRGKLQYITNVVRLISYGLRSDATGGFTPTNFFADGIEGRRLITESNGFAYLLLKNQAPELIDQTGAGLSIPHDSFVKRSYFIRFVLAMMAVAPMLWIVIRTIGRRKEQQRKQGNE